MIRLWTSSLVLAMYTGSTGGMPPVQLISWLHFSPPPTLSSMKFTREEKGRTRIPGWGLEQSGGVLTAPQMEA